MRQPTFHPLVADEQPEEMIPGEIPAPAISLGNPDVVLHHLSAIAASTNGLPADADSGVLFFLPTKDD